MRLVVDNNNASITNSFHLLPPFLGFFLLCCLGLSLLLSIFQMVALLTVSGTCASWSLMAIAWVYCWSSMGCRGQSIIDKVETMAWKSSCDWTSFSCPEFEPRKGEVRLRSLIILGDVLYSGCRMPTWRSEWDPSEVRGGRRGCLRNSDNYGPVCDVDPFWRKGFILCWDFVPLLFLWQDVR